jgi:GldM N-terminal domain
MFRFIITITVFQSLISCSGNSGQELRTLKIAEEGLIQSNNFLEANNLVVYKVLEQRLDESYSSENARVWQPKALLIKRKSELVYSYLDSLILELKKKSGLKLVASTEVFDEQNVTAAEEVLIGKNTAENIVSRLFEYKNEVLAVDPELNDVFKKEIVIISRQFQTAEDNKVNVAGSLFKDIPVLAAIVILRRFQNNIVNTEGELILFCLNKIPSKGGYGFDVFRILVGQSSSIVKGGENIKIQAGVGAFSVASNPTVIVDGKILKPQEGNGYIEYNFKVPEKDGKYAKNITIEYISEDGTQRKVIQSIKYTVKN